MRSTNLLTNLLTSQLHDWFSRLCSGFTDFSLVCLSVLVVVVSALSFDAFAEILHPVGNGNSGAAAVLCF